MLSPRQWLCSGGGGFEDGEDGIRACHMSAEYAIELMEAYAQYVLEQASGSFSIRDLRNRANKTDYEKEILRLLEENLAR
jgi:hypothetical protein